MDEQLTATIIPFPSRQRDLGQKTEQLTTSLTSLSVALTAQRDALQRWRAALAELQERMQTIGTAGR